MNARNKELNMIGRRFDEKTKNLENEKKNINAS